MQEIWKPLPFYPFSQYFMVSNLGNVKAIKKYSKTKPFTPPEQVIKPTLCSWGYYTVRITAEKQHADYFIHRLVATAFIPNPQNKTQVNHIDGNKLNNCVDNLEWVTPSENIQHAYDTGLMSYYKRNHPKIPVYQFSKDGEFIKEWDSAVQAHRELNINASSISSCIYGKRPSAGGFLWSHNKELNCKK